MAVTAAHLVGRADELGALVGLLDAVERLPAVTVVKGEAGMGKTTLLTAGTTAATERGYRTVSTRPSEAETRFSYAGLADLLDGADEIVGSLPAVQRRSIEGALLLGESDAVVDERAVPAAFLQALRLMCRDGRLCLAVDDVQWLDAASLTSLRYALARLDAEPIAVMLAVRGDVPEWIRRAVPEQRLRIVELSGLSLGAIYELLRTRSGATFARPTMIRIWETTKGNPFFALELAAALQRRGSSSLGPGEDLPIPARLDELLRARMDGLDAAAIEAARVVAAVADPTVGLLETVLGKRFDRALAAALDARILDLDGEHVRFTHPLLGSAVTARQTPPRRRALHARLAEIVPSAEERARHLALATPAPDRHVAAVLEQAARAAHLAGVPAAAADLAEQAHRLTPASDREDVMRRGLTAAEMHGRAGDTDRAIGLLEQARATAASGDERATVLAALAGVRPSTDNIGLYYDALTEARDESLRASIHIRLATAMRWGDGIAQAVEHAELAVRAAEHIDDAAVRCRALAVLGVTRFYAGQGIAMETMREAMELERSLAQWPIDEGPTVQFAYQLLWSADTERGYDVAGELVAAARSRNDPAAEAEGLWFLSFLAWRAGEWEQGRQHAADMRTLLAQLGMQTPPQDLPAAVIAAHRGDIDEARTIARAAIARADGRILIAESGHGWVLGFVELSLGDPNAALVHLRRSYAIRNAYMLEPAQRLELGDLVEALIAVGELDEAAEVLATWQKRAEALDRAWALGILARCRGLHLAASGHFDDAFASFDNALAEHARSTDPFHRARTLLALGRTQRRAKRRAAARTTLEEAAAAFDVLGAPLWAEQARAELARIGGRAPSQKGLTEAESLVAGLVAQGRTNREVAAALFLTEHSVETALTRIYRKLGVRSRAELVRLLAVKS